MASSRRSRNERPRRPRLLKDATAAASGTRSRGPRTARRPRRRGGPGAGCSASACSCCLSAHSRSAHGGITSSSVRSWTLPSSRRNFVPSVRVEAVAQRHGNMHVSLPGTTLAFEAANIYARASGYICKRNVDIGDHVKAGQLLAEITAPGVDDQVAQRRTRSPQARRRCCRSKANLRPCARDLGPQTSRSSRRAGSPSSRATTDVRTFKAHEASARRRPSQCRGAACAAQGTRISRRPIRAWSRRSTVSITQRNIDVGSLVQADATSGTFLFTHDAEQRHPHPGLCAAGAGLRRNPGSRPSCACPRCPDLTSRAK